MYSSLWRFIILLQITITFAKERTIQEIQLITHLSNFIAWNLSAINETCKLEGILCDSEEEIIGLNFASLELKFSLPELTPFGHLMILELQGNSLSGCLKVPQTVQFCNITDNEFECTSDCMPSKCRSTSGCLEPNESLKVSPHFFYVSLLFMVLGSVAILVCGFGMTSFFVFSSGNSAFTRRFLPVNTSDESEKPPPVISFNNIDPLRCFGEIAGESEALKLEDKLTVFELFPSKSSSRTINSSCIDPASIRMSYVESKFYPRAADHQLKGAQLRKVDYLVYPKVEQSFKKQCLELNKGQKDWITAWYGSNSQSIEGLLTELIGIQHGKEPLKSWSNGVYFTRYPNLQEVKGHLFNKLLLCYICPGTIKTDNQLEIPIINSPTDIITDGEQVLVFSPYQILPVYVVYYTFHHLNNRPFKFFPTAYDSNLQSRKRLELQLTGMVMTTSYLVIHMEARDETILGKHQLITKDTLIEKNDKKLSNSKQDQLLKTSSDIVNLQTGKSTIKTDKDEPISKGKEKINKERKISE